MAKHVLVARASRHGVIQRSVQRRIPGVPIFLIGVLSRNGAVFASALMRLRIAILMASFGLLAPTAAAAAPTKIAVLGGATAVESYGGVAVWSDYDPTNRSWHVVVRRDGQISTPPIPTAGKAIEVDIGPGPSGAPMLAYVSCARTCHVMVSGVDGSAPQMVPGSGGASHPTIWGDRVAWVSGKAKVITSHVDGSERRALAGAPHRKCYYKEVVTPARLICEAPQLPEVEALQLYRSQLALIDTFILNDNIGAVGTTTEVRTEAISGGPQRLIALLGVGEGDESWLGPSWSNGKLYFYEDSLGAGFVSYRFDPARDTYASARAHTYLTGFSVVGDRAYEATAAGDPRGGFACPEEPAESCVVRLSEPFTFKPSRAPVHVP
jgi:hypothetical protein